MGLRFLGHSSQQRYGGCVCVFVLVRVKRLPGTGWTLLLCPVWDTRAGVEHGVRYVQGW